MTYLFFTAAFIIYGLYSWLCYLPAMKNSAFMMPLGLGLALAANVLWILLSKRTTDNPSLFFYAACWDALISITAVGVPVLLFGLRVNAMGWWGLGLLALGILLIKQGVG